MSRPPPRSPHTDPLFPYTTLFRPNAPDRSADRTAQASAALRRGHRPAVRRAVLLLPADLRTGRRTAARLSAGRRDDDRHRRRLALPDTVQADLDGRAVPVDADPPVPDLGLHRPRPVKARKAHPPAPPGPPEKR